MHYRLSFVLAACLIGLAGTGWGQDESPQDLSQLVQKVKDLAGQKKYAEAADVMKQVLRLQPGNHLYLAYAAEFERQAGRYADGLAHAEEAIRINPKVGPYRVVAAANAFANHDLARAREHVQAVLKGGTAEFGKQAMDDAQAIEALLTPRTYTISWDLDPAKGQPAGNVWQVALPKSELPYQSATYTVSGARSYRVVKGEANDVLHVIPQGKRPFQLVMRITARPYSYKARLAQRKPGPVPPAVRVYLGPSDGINPASPVLVKAVAGLKAADAAETVRNIAAWMKEHIAYKFDKKKLDELDFKSADEILERGHAECRGYAVLFTALCRAAGVPARPIWGLAILPAERGRYASHNWSEVYLTGVGWVPVDPQKPESFGLLPNNDLRFFMDMKKNASTRENVPMFNLLYMNGPKLKVEESR